MANGALIRAILPAVIDAVRSSPKASVGELMTAVAPKVAADPVVVNATSQEKPWQSGVTVAGGGGLAIGIGTLLVQWGSGTLSLETIDPAIIGMLVLSAWGLWRRWAPGLKPLGQGWIGRLFRRS